MSISGTLANALSGLTAASRAAQLVSSNVSNAMTEGYTFEIESVNSGEVTSTKPVEHYALIREARLGSDGVEIVFAGGATVPSTDVRALRSPQAQL